MQRDIDKAFFKYLSEELGFKDAEIMSAWNYAVKKFPNERFNTRSINKRYIKR